ncbi:MAG: NYN domain-containing protein [Chloroflexi bacterium]|nr:NYN domain-containing protein [Chloroflexota bacterium]
MRVAIYFDGKNFYEALRAFDPLLEIDFERFATWLTSTVGGPEATFVGAFYYTGYSNDPAIGPLTTAQGLDVFLDYLSYARGYFVRREPRVRRTTVCRNCHTSYEYTEEKRVDTRIVADLIHYAAVDAFDIAILVSGDDDFSPAVVAVRELGKQIYVGAWPGQGVARELRAEAFGKIDFGTGVDHFARRSAHAPGPAGTTPQSSSPVMDEAGLAGLSEQIEAELRVAEGQLPYVSRWYFVNRWRGSGEPQERERSLDRLVANGRAEEYTFTDDKGRLTVAIRATPRDAITGSAESATATTSPMRTD